MDRFRLQDEQGNEIAEISTDTTQRYSTITSDENILRTEEDQTQLAILFLEEVSPEIRGHLLSLLNENERNSLNQEEIDHRLRELGLFRKPPLDREPEQIEPSQAHTAETLHESNRIEDIEEASSKGILQQVRNDVTFGHVGAWQILKEEAKKSPTINPATLREAHRRLFLEQEWLGHRLPDKPLSPREFQDMMAKIQRIQSQKDLDQLQLEREQALREERAGKLRDEWVNIAGKPVPPPNEEDFEKLFHDLNVDMSKLHEKKQPSQKEVIDLTAKYHLAFEELHPFIDGNGRVGRLLIHAILARFGLPELLIPFSKRQEYYDSFQTGDHRAMADFFKSCFTEASQSLLD